MKRVITLSIIALFYASITYGAELYSPHFPHHASGDTLVCSIFNAGAKEMTGLIQICGIKGCSSECKLGGGLMGNGTLLPEGWSSCSSTYDGSSGAAFCKISFNGNPRDVRALSCLVDDVTGEVTACAPIE